jgi:hypothetical protein
MVLKASQGQINVELKKPGNSEKLYANLYVNDFGKTDLNLNLSQPVGKKWSTSLLLHDDFLTNKNLDFNHDGFRDLPTGNLFTAINRWSFDNTKGLMSQFGVKFLNDQRTGGQLDYDASKDRFTTNNYGLEINTKRIEGFGKIGYVFPQKKYKSIGLQLSAFDHKQNSYLALQVTMRTSRISIPISFINPLFIRPFTNSGPGLVFCMINMTNCLTARIIIAPKSCRVPFFEYTFTPTTTFDIVAGHS